MANRKGVILGRVKFKKHNLNLYILLYEDRDFLLYTVYPQNLKH